MMAAKEEIRQKVWSVMQREKVARFPGAQGRIPNFVGAEACIRLLAEIILEARQSFEMQSRLTATSDSAQSSCRRQDRLYGGAAPARPETIYQARSSEAKLFPVHCLFHSGCGKIR